MPCAKCEAHRQAIKTAAKAGLIVATVGAVAKATVALGEDAGRRLIRRKSK